MHIKHPIYILFLISLLGSGIISCSATKVKQAVLMPANTNEMKNVKKLAIVGFSGDKNNQFSSKMENFFTNIKVKNKPYFTVIDHATLTRIMREQDNPIATDQTVGSNNSATNTTTNSNNPENGENVGISLSFKDPIEILGALFLSTMDSATTNAKVSSAPTTIKPAFSRDDAIKMARVSGADTIITGSVDGPRINNVPYKEDRSICVETEKNKDKCKKYGSIKISCIKQQGTLNFVMKAVDVENGKITFSNNYSGRSENSYCTDTKSNMKPDSTLMTTALENAIQTVRNDVAPYIAIVTIELMDKDESGLSDNKNAKTLLETGLEFADKKQLRQACDNFRLASQSYNQSPALYHNLGVCAELKNNLDEALNLFNQASDLSKKPHNLISAALARVNGRMEKNKQVASQLR